MKKVFFLSLLLCACSGNSLPKGVLPQEKMEAVLYDVIRADEMADVLKLRDSTYNKFSKRTALYDTVFQLHAVTKEAFQQSMNYYKSRPDLLKEMLEDMHKNIADTGRTRRLGVQPVP
jgi:hypothetical protein